MVEKRVRVGSAVGLHARPATLVAQEAASLPAQVMIGRDSQSIVDARSVLSILTLDARQGDELVLVAEGQGAEVSLDRLAALIERDLDKE